MTGRIAPHEKLIYAKILVLQSGFLNTPSKGSYVKKQEFSLVAHEKYYNLLKSILTGDTKGKIEQRFENVIIA